MYKSHCDIINPGDNVIIGLGDSFTQGIGAYSLETWKSMTPPASLYNIAGQFFVEEQGKNNWIVQLRNNHLPDYKVFNLGVNGAGNRAAVKELYLNPLPANLGNVVVILMATGIERFDFLKQSDATAGPEGHQKWQTIFPAATNRGSISAIDTEYLKQIWTQRNDALEFLFNVADAHSFCKANNDKFVFASAFDQFINKEQILINLEDRSQYHTMIDWDAYIPPASGKTFMDMVRNLEGITNRLTQTDAHAYYQKLDVPSKYVTPCFHWSVEGCKVVAGYMFDELTKRNII